MSIRTVYADGRFDVFNDEFLDQRKANWKRCGGPFFGHSNPTEDFDLTWRSCKVTGSSVHWQDGDTSSRLQYIKVMPKRSVRSIEG